MLVLTRRRNQSIVINDDIVVTVLEVKGDQIRLGITAPRDVPVYREELVAVLTDADRASVLPEEAHLPEPSSTAASAAPRPARSGRPRSAA